MHRSIFLLLLLVGKIAFSQDLDFNLMLNAEQTGEANNPVYQTLRQSLSEFVNQTSWTDRNTQPQERIKGSMFITLVAREGTTFSGTIEIQASRPVYGASMQTPIFSFRDDNFIFDYIEHENLEYSPNVFQSNLVSVVAFYINTIMGLDADTFEIEGGSSFYQEANQIVSAAQASNHSGWSASDGRQSRYSLNADLLSSAYSGYRHALYTYHRDGLDLMHESLDQGKQGVRDAILQLEELNDSRPGAMLTRIFFDAKAREIQQIFSGGPNITMEGVYSALSRMAPTYSNLWRNLPQ